MWIALLLLAAAGQTPAVETGSLVERARAVALSDRPQAEALLRQALAAYEKEASKSAEYAAALDLLGMTLYPSLAANKEALTTQIEPLFKKALELRQADPGVSPASKALALELEAMLLEATGRLDDSRDPKSKARALRDQIITAMQPPAEDLIAGSTHIGPTIEPPQLMARADPAFTFESRLLKLAVTDVMAEVIIGTDGLIHQIEIFRPAGFGLDESAVQALMQWRFKPARKNGAPIPVEGNIKLRFR